MSTNKNNAFIGILLPPSEKIYRARLKKAKDVKIVTNIGQIRLKALNKRSGTGVTVSTIYEADDNRESGERVKNGVTLRPPPFCPCNMFAIDGILCKHMIALCLHLKIEGRNLCERRHTVANYIQMFEELGGLDGLKQRMPDMHDLVKIGNLKTENCTCEYGKCICIIKYPNHIYEKQMVLDKKTGLVEPRETCNKCGWCNNRVKEKKRGPKPHTRYKNADPFEGDGNHHK